MDWFRSKQKKSLDLDKIYLTVQFLTQEQKVKKDLALGQIYQKFKQEEETIIPFQQYFSCSYRFTFNAKQINNLAVQNPKIMVKQVIANIILSTNQKTKNFYQTYINGIQVIMQNNQALGNNDIIPLYDEREIALYNPQQILQIVYTQKSLWQRIKNKTKTTIKSIPSMLSTLVQKLIGFIMVMLGLNGGISSLIWKAIPSKMILQWIGMIVSMFFPFLGPILGITKLIL